MSDRRDDEGPRDNTSPEHKPENAANTSKAPKGSIGLQNSHPSLNLGGAQNREFTFVLEADEQHKADQTTPAPEDTRPIAIKSGDKEIDAQSEADGFQLKSQEEIDQLSGEDTPDQPQNSYDDMMQSDGSTPFQATNDPEVNQHYKDRGETAVPQSLGSGEPSQSNNPKAGYDRPQMSQSDYARAFQQASERTNEISKSKEQDIE